MIKQDTDHLVRSSREKLTELKKERKNRRFLEEESKIRIVPVKWLIAVILCSLATLATIGHLEPFLFYFVIDLVFIFVMLSKLLDRKKRRDDAREKLKGSRPIRAIDAEIAENKRIVDSAKRILGYKKNYSDSDYIAILKWIIYAKPSTADIFSCWPFDIFSSFYLKRF